MFFCWVDLDARDAEKQILRFPRLRHPANDWRRSSGPRLAGSQDDTASRCRTKWTTGDVL